MKLTKEQREKIEQTVDESTATFIDELPNMVRRILSGGVHSILGLRIDNNYGSDHRTWSVDHGNGRDNMLSKIISTKCKENVDKFIVPIANQAIENIAKDEEFLLSLVAEAEEQFRRAFHGSIGEQARRFGKEQAEAVVRGLDDVELTVLIDENADIANPKAHTTKIGHYLAEHIAASLCLNPSKK